MTGEAEPCAAGDGTILFGAASGKIGDENEDEIENRNRKIENENKIEKENKNMVHFCHCTTADTLQRCHTVMVLKMMIWCMDVHLH